jgi:ATP phosphoribosyltransferase regulatory subunit
MGFSIYPDPLLDLLAAVGGARRVFLPLGHDPVQAAALRRQGWVTVAALGESCDAAACTHVLRDGAPVPFT